MISHDITWHDACVTWYIYIAAILRYKRVMSQLWMHHVTWHIYNATHVSRDMMHPYVWHDTFISLQSRVGTPHIICIDGSCDTDEWHHTYGWVMWHRWMIRVTHIDASYRGGEKHRWMIRFTHVKRKKRHRWMIRVTYVGRKKRHRWMIHATYVGEKKDTDEWFVSLMWGKKKTQMNDSCHLCEKNKRHRWMIRVTHIDASYRVHVNASCYACKCVMSHI